MILIKFWIHISSEEQLKRFKRRENDPLKGWKLTDEDWRNREKRGAYERAVEDMLERTDHELSRWQLVEGDSKRWARVKVLETVISEIERGMRERGFEPPAEELRPAKLLPRRKPSSDPLRLPPPLQRRLLLLAPLAAVALVAGVIAATSSNGSGHARAAALVDPGGKPGVPKRPNVVLIVMDEFPGDSLLGPDRRIDAVRYPNLAALAGNATWFPNAFTRYDSTPRRSRSSPTAGGRSRARRPTSATTGARSSTSSAAAAYRIHSSEEATAICPPATARAPARAARGSCAI